MRATALAQTYVPLDLACSVWSPEELPVPHQRAPEILPLKLQNKIDGWERRRWIISDRGKNETEEAVRVLHRENTGDARTPDGVRHYQSAQSRRQISSCRQVNISYSWR